jgi:hypothetical protein
MFKDDFNRYPSTDLGDDWNETDGEANGDWEIIEQILHEKYGEGPGEGGTADAILFCNVPVPIHNIKGRNTDGEMYVLVSVIDPVEDDIYRIYPCCPDNEHVGDVVVEFAYNGSNLWTITIDTEEFAATGDPDPLTGEVILAVCADHTFGQMKASIGTLGISPTLFIDIDPGSGQIAAIGHNNASTGAIFDNFEIGELRSQKEICSTCFCFCDNQIMPFHLHGEFHFCSVTEKTRMACMEDMENISWDMYVKSGVSSVIWYGEKLVYTVGNIPVAQLIKFTLNCVNLELSIVVHEGMSEVPCACFAGTWAGMGLDSMKAVPRLQSEGLTYDGYEPAYSTCDPLSLVYGPWENSARDDCQWCYKQTSPSYCVGLPPPGDPFAAECWGQFWIVITE